eukprot:Pgem_evm2s16872
MISNTSVNIRRQSRRPFTKTIIKKQYPKHRLDNDWITNKVTHLNIIHNKYDTMFKMTSEEEVHKWIKSKIENENKILTNYKMSRDIFNFGSEIVQLLEYNDGQYLKFIMSEVFLSVEPKLHLGILLNKRINVFHYLSLHWSEKVCENVNIIRYYILLWHYFNYSKDYCKFGEFTYNLGSSINSFCGRIKVKGLRKSYEAKQKNNESETSLYNLCKTLSDNLDSLQILGKIELTNG